MHFSAPCAQARRREPAARRIGRSSAIDAPRNCFEFSTEKQLGPPPETASYVDEHFLHLFVIEHAGSGDPVRDRFVHRA